MVDRHGLQPEGYVLLSHQKASRLRSGTIWRRRMRDQLAGFRPRDGAHQRRTHGGCGRAGVHARIAGGCAAHARSGLVPRPGYSGQDRQAQSPARQRGGVAQDGDRRGTAHAQERRAGGSGRRRGGHRHGEEPDRIWRVRRPGRHRRPAARQRHVARPRESSLRSGARRRRDHRQGSEVRPRQGTHFARVCGNWLPIPGKPSRNAIRRARA